MEEGKKSGKSVREQTRRSRWRGVYRDKAPLKGDTRKDREQSQPLRGGEGRGWSDGSRETSFTVRQENRVRGAGQRGSSMTGR